MHHLTTFPNTAQLIMHNRKNQQKYLARNRKKDLAIVEYLKGTHFEIFESFKSKRTKRIPSLSQGKRQIVGDCGIAFDFYPSRSSGLFFFLTIYLKYMGTYIHIYSIQCFVHNALNSFLHRAFKIKKRYNMYTYKMVGINTCHG